MFLLRWVPWIIWALGGSLTGLQAAPPIGPALPDRYLKPAPEPLGPSSRRGPIVISELMYHPADRADGRNTQFIELFNAQVFFEDLSGWSLRGDINYTFPTNTVLGARSFLVVAANPVDFGAAYPGIPALGPFQNVARLPNSAGTLRLFNRLGAVSFELKYRDDGRWPVAPDGGGHSLVLARPSYGERDPWAWGQSERPGGSPGTFEPERTHTALDSIVLNELLAHTEPPFADYVELYNYSEATVDLSGCILTDDPATNRFVVPSGSQISARGWAVFTQAELGFALNAGGERLFLFAPNRDRVLDSIRFEAQENGVAWGRSPDGAAQFSRLQTSTPGAANAAPRLSSVVLNELMYHPASERPEDQYIELHNAGDTGVDLSAWRLEGGVHFTFPTGSRLAAHDFIVVAKDAAHLRTNYPELAPHRLVGDYSGSLSGLGERLTLTKPDPLVQTNKVGKLTTNTLQVVVDEVTYGTGGRWGKWSDGGGSSLERRDPRSDGRPAANWTDSDESEKSPWVTVEAIGPTDLGNTAADAFQILTQGPGECLIDDVEIIATGGTNRVINHSFDTSLAGWTFQGNHAGSTWEPREGASAPGCLHLRATGSGTTGPNRAFTKIAAVPASSTANSTLRARVRWLKGTPNLLLRLKGNSIEAPGTILAARNLGTPGSLNSAFRGYSPPTISEVAHFPILPRTGEIVRVTARVADSTGLASVTAWYHSDSANNYSQLVLTNSGAGWFSAELPPLSGFQQFYIVATNTAGVSTTFPDDAPDRECNLRYGETTPAGSLGQYHLWVSKTNVSRWTKRAKLANELIDTTFVYGAARIIYNAGSQYSGSPFHAPSYDTPTGANCDYVVAVPPDDRFLGEEELNLLQPGNGGGDGTGQAEQQAYWIADQLGLPHCHRRHILLWFNGIKRGVVYEDAQQPNGDFVKQWFPNDAEGELRKIQLWFEFDADGSAFNAFPADLGNYVSRGKKKMARYRWTWPLRSFGNYPNNYTNLYSLVDAVNTRETGDRYVKVLEQATDVDEWFHTHVTEHLVGNNDSYSYGGGQNMYAYLPGHGPWKLLIWDIDFAFAAGGPTEDMVTIGGANVGPVNSTGTFSRKYYQAMLDAVHGPLETNRFQPILDARYAGLRANGATGVSSPSAIKAYLKTRRDSVIRLINSANAPLGLSSAFSNGVTSGANLITLSGTAPLDARTLTLNGEALAVSWTSRTAWTAKVPLPSGSNTFVLNGLDGFGQPLTNPPVPIAISITQPTDSPVGQVQITEILPTPSFVGGASWIELYNASLTTAFDLSGWRIEGLNYTFPAGTTLAANGRLVVPSDRFAFNQTYGPQIPLAGQFSGRLDAVGEVLRLIQPGPTPKQDQLIDEVRYSTLTPWPTPEAGSSLQLIDIQQDNRRPANWLTASRTTPPTSWLQAVATGLATSSTVYLYLENPGDVYVDDLRLVAGTDPNNGPNLIPGGDFEGVFPGSFLVADNHAASAIASDQAHTGAQSLHLVATSDGVSRASAITLDLPAPLAQGAEYTLSFWYQPRVGGGLLTARLSGSGIKVTAELDSAGTVLGLPATPGAPNTSAHPLPTLYPLTLNELMPENSGTVRDNLGHFRPWLELYNSAERNQPLTNCFLSPSLGNLAAWRFPDGAVVPAHGFLTVWLDGDSAASTARSPHTDFAVDPSGFLALSQEMEGRLGVLDFLEYESPGPDRSLGDFPDADLLRRHVFSTPTPEAYNTLAAPTVRVFINEWLADNNSVLADPADGDFEDWFELYNGGAAPINLAGYFLGNSLTSPIGFRIPAGYTIPAGERLLVWADHEPEQNSSTRTDLHVNFKLSKNGGSLVFADPDGVVLDTVTFGAQPKDISEGRQPDGGGYFGALNPPTPRTANPLAPPSPTITKARFTHDTFTVEFTGLPGRKYRLQTRTDLTPELSGWESRDARTTDVQGQGSFVSPAELNHSTAFFRLLLLP